MSGVGVTYYDEQIKYLLRLLKALPETIPTGAVHDFIGYKPDPEKVKDAGCVKSVVSHSLEISFGSRHSPANNAKVTVTFKSRGKPLEEVTTVLRDHITGNAGANALLTLWVDDLIEGATAAINAAGDRVCQSYPSKF